MTFFGKWKQKALWTLCLSAWVAFVAPLAALNPERKADSYSIQGWFTKDGLPSNKIRDVVQTRDGYLWIATAQGLARFDGSRFTVYTTATNPELHAGGFFAVEEAPDGTLWFGGDNGLFRWHDGHFDRFTTEQGLANNYVRALALAGDGSVVACTRTGYSFVRGGRIVTPGGAWAQTTGVARSYLEMADGSTLLGTDDGLWRISGGGIERLSGTPGFQGNGFTSLLKAADGSVWIGYNLGLRCIHPDGSRVDYGPAQGLLNPVVMALHTDADGNLWIATHGGLYRLTDGRIQAANYPDQFGGTAIQQLYEDREGGLWISSAGGLFHLKDTIGDSIDTADGLSQITVYSVFQSADSLWWIGLWGGGVYRYDQNTATPLNVPASLGLDQVLSFAEEPKGTIWIGADSGLYRHSANGTVNLFRPDRAEAWTRQIAQHPGTVLPGIAHRRTNSIAADGEGGLWVATDGALYHGNAGHFRAYTAADGLPGNTFKSVIRTRGGDTWVTAPPGGVARFHAGRWTNYLCGRAISDVYPRAVYEDASGAIWVTTEGGGLNRFKDGRWRTFTAADGLADNFISGIVEDASGNLWVAYPRGIMRIPESEFDEFAAGRRTGLQPQIFNNFDGLPSGEINQQGSPNAWRASDGRLLFATDRGVAVVDPSAIKVNRYVPPMHIEQFRMDGADADLSRPLVVPPGSNDLEIEYTAISLLAPEKVRFKIRLSPLDRDWVDTGGRRDVRYANLPPGAYTFQAIAYNNDGVWNREGVTLAFSVQPLFYQTGWFRALVVLALLGTAVGTYRARVRIARRKMAALEDLVKVRTRESQLEKEAKEAAEQAVRARNEVITALKQAEVEREEMHRQLLDISRRAGMAEVATGVLHNIGNVLNSVNVSAQLVSDEVRESKACNVPKIATILREHSDHLGTFMEEDPRGRMIPSYLADLGADLVAEQKVVVEELSHLSKNVEHIKDIVAMQQSYAKVSRITETIALSELADNALQMSSTGHVREGLEIVREYLAEPSVTVEPHKVLQILINLIRNAKNACDESGRADKRLVVRITQSDGRVRVAVIDNGVGISPENLRQLFAHGFTTRKAGHGFGLHSAALAAKELGATLTAASDGPGTGAVFTLEFPASPQPPSPSHERPAI